MNKKTFSSLSHFFIFTFFFPVRYVRPFKTSDIDLQIKCCRPILISIFIIRVIGRN